MSLDNHDEPGSATVPVQPSSVRPRDTVVIGTILFVTSPDGFDQFLEALVPVKIPEVLDKMLKISAAYGVTYPTLGVCEATYKPE